MMEIEAPTAGAEPVLPTAGAGAGTCLCQFLPHGCTAHLSACPHCCTPIRMRCDYEVAALLAPGHVVMPRDDEVVVLSRTARRSASRRLPSRG